MQATGERVLEEARLRSLVDYAVWRFHLATYEWASAYTEAQNVVDFGCGTGYGAALIAENAHQVRAYDVSEEAIKYAKRTYTKSNLAFERIDGELPVASESVDSVLSFQVIEHVDPNPYLSDIRRVLRPDGRSLFATPNREGRLFSWQEPWNRWHLTEYDADGFEALLLGHFSHVELFEVRADEELLDAQWSYWRRARWASLPFTFPGVPEIWRQKGLQGLSRLKPRNNRPIEEPNGNAWVAPFTGDGVDILAVARL